MQLAKGNPFNVLTIRNYIFNFKAIFSLLGYVVILLECELFVWLVCGHCLFLYDYDSVLWHCCIQKQDCLLRNVTVNCIGVFSYVLLCRHCHETKKICGVWLKLNAANWFKLGTGWNVSEIRTLISNFLVKLRAQALFRRYLAEFWRNSAHLVISLL
jgi:hypothetical protein